MNEYRELSQLGITEISPQAVEIAQLDIAANPQMFVLNEGARIAESNPHLNSLLMTRLSLLPAETGNDFIEGSLWVYRIIRAEFESRGAEVPTVPKALVTPHLVDSVEKSKEVTSLNQFIQNGWESMASKQPKLAAALKEMTKYQGLRFGTMFGATETYSLIEKTEKSKSMNNIFTVAPEVYDQNPDNS